MKELIDKSALVAEIEKLKKTYNKLSTRNNYEDGLKDGRLIGYKDALDKINNLDVKEVDFTWKQEEKQLLLADLCSRLPYGVILEINKVITEKLYNILCRKNTSDWFVNGYNLDYNEVKPYLRTVASMTDKEYNEYLRMIHEESAYIIVNYLNSIHVDHCGLIEKGLALKAPEGMYKMEEEQ